MKKHIKWLSFLLVLVAIGLAGCGSNSNKSSKNAEQTSSAKKMNQVLSGAYKIDAKYGKADDGTDRPAYWYFKKDGKLLRCTPETGDEDSGYYGEAMRGTWKSLGNDEYQLKFHDVYDNDSYSIKAKVSGNKLTTYATPKSAKYEWDKDTNTKIDMTYSDFMSMFNKAKESDQKNIQENGYDEPDDDDEDDTSSSSSSTSSHEINSADEAIAAVKAKFDPEGKINWSYMSSGDGDTSTDDDGNECYWIRGQDKDYSNDGAGSYDGHDYYVYKDGTIKER